jgi:conjugal transfer pilus assembly protein TraA
LYGPPEALRRTTCVTPRVVVSAWRIAELGQLNLKGIFLMRKMFTQKSKALAALGVFAAVAAASVYAGTGGSTEFGALSSQLVGWAQGQLGIVIAVAALLVGLAIGVVKQSLMSVVTGFGIAIALYYGPEVIQSILTATGGVHALHAAAIASLPVF